MSLPKADLQDPPRPPIVRVSARHGTATQLLSSSSLATSTSSPLASTATITTADLPATTTANRNSRPHISIPPLCSSSSSASISTVSPPDSTPESPAIASPVPRYRSARGAGASSNNGTSTPSSIMSSSSTSSSHQQHSHKSLRSQSSKSSIFSSDIASPSSSSSLSFMHKLSHLHHHHHNSNPPASPASNKPDLQQPPLHSLNNSQISSTPSHTRTPSACSTASSASTSTTASQKPKYTTASLRSPQSSIQASESLLSKHQQPSHLDPPIKLESPVPKYLHHPPSSTSSSSSALSAQIRSPSSTRTPLNELRRPSSTSSSASSPSMPPSPTSTSVKETNYVVIDVNPVSGRKLLNKYEIIKELGRGQHGKVKLALDTETNEFVAIKIVDRLGKPKLGRVRPGLSHEDKVRREIAIMKKCHHPNIVNLIEVLDDSSSKIYLVLEYLERGEVHWQDADGNPALTQDQARDVARDVISGLEYLHFQGIIHRDIKPANLLRDKNDTVKISDFGVSYASNLDANTSDEFELAKTAGTPAFFAPELCATSSPDGGPRPPITAKIDIWAFGVTLFCLIYGKLPFSAENEFELFDVIANDPLVFPDEVPEFPVPKKKRNFHSIFYNVDASSESLADLEDEQDGQQSPPQDDDNIERPPVVPNPALASVKDLLRKVLEKDPTKRIDLNGIKHHPWMMEGMDLPRLEHFLTETTDDQRIVVTNEDVQRAVSGIGSRIKRGISRGLSRLGSSALHFAGLRRKGSSSSSSANPSGAPSRSVSRDAHRSPSASTIGLKSPKQGPSRSDVKARNKKYFESSTILSSTSSGHESDYSTTSSSRFNSRKNTGNSAPNAAAAMAATGTATAINDNSLQLIDQAILSSRRSTSSSFSSLSSLSSLQSGGPPLTWQTSNPREYQVHSHTRDKSLTGAILSRTNSNTTGVGSTTSAAVAAAASGDPAHLAHSLRSPGSLSPTMPSPITPVMGAIPTDLGTDTRQKSATPRLTIPSFSPFRGGQLLSEDSDEESVGSGSADGVSLVMPPPTSFPARLPSSRNNLKLHSILTDGASTGADSDDSSSACSPTQSCGPLSRKQTYTLGDYGDYYGASGYSDGYDYDDKLGTSYNSTKDNSVSMPFHSPSNAFSSSGLATPVAGSASISGPSTMTTMTGLGPVPAAHEGSMYSTGSAISAASTSSYSTLSGLKGSSSYELPQLDVDDADSGLFGDDERGFGDDSGLFLRKKSTSSFYQHRLSTSSGHDSLQPLSSVPESTAAPIKINALTPAHLRKGSQPTLTSSSAASINSVSSSSSDEGGGGLTLVVERKKSNTPASMPLSENTSTSSFSRKNSLPPIPTPTYATISRLVSTPGPVTPTGPGSVAGSGVSTPTNARFSTKFAPSTASRMSPHPTKTAATTAGFNPSPVNFNARRADSIGSTASRLSTSSGGSEVLPLPSNLASEMLGGGLMPLSPGFASDDMEHIVAHHTYRQPPGVSISAPMTPGRSGGSGGMVPLAYSATGGSGLAVLSSSGSGYSLHATTSRDSTVSAGSSSSANSSSGSLVINVPRRSTNITPSSSRTSKPGNREDVKGPGDELLGRGRGPGSGAHVRSQSVAVGQVQYHRQIVDAYKCDGSAYNYTTPGPASPVCGAGAGFCLSDSDDDDDSDNDSDGTQELQLEFGRGSSRVRSPVGK